MSQKQSVKVLNKDNFDTYLSESTLPVLVDFWAEWCAPCRVVAPSVARLAEEYDGRLRVAKLDIDAEPELAHRFDIRAIPSLLVFRAGEVVKEIRGALPYRELERAVSEQLAPTA